MNKLISDLYNSKAVRWHQKQPSSASILDGQISTFWYGTSSDVPRPSLSGKTAVGSQSNLGVDIDLNISFDFIVSSDCCLIDVCTPDLFSIIMSFFVIGCCLSVANFITYYYNSITSITIVLHLLQFYYIYYIYYIVLQFYYILLLISILCVSWIFFVFLFLTLTTKFWGYKRMHLSELTLWTISINAGVSVVEHCGWLLLTLILTIVAFLLIYITVLIKLCLWYFFNELVWSCKCLAKMIVRLTDVTLTICYQGENKIQIFVFIKVSLSFNMTNCVIAVMEFPLSVVIYIVKCTRCNY